MNGRIIGENLAFPEGPAFDRQGRLWLVELKAGSLVCCEDGGLRRVQVGGEPNGIAIDARDRVVFCDADLCAIRCHDPRSGETATLADTLDGEPLFKPNDLAFDASGNLAFTCPGNSRTEPTGYVAVLTPGGEVRRVASGFYFPNGLAFTPDGRHLVVAETRRQRLWRGRWDADHARWLAPRPWASVGGTIGPDGMAFAADGQLYVAIYSGGAIKVVAPDGEVEEVLELSGANPTNCAFDPSGDLGLVVTEAEQGRLLAGVAPRGVKGAQLFAGEIEDLSTSNQRETR
jgi:gluconolactonase